MESFEKLIGLMKACEENTDYEVAHREADDILSLALIEAAAGNINMDQAQQLIDVYDAVGKWYA